MAEPDLPAVLGGDVARWLSRMLPGEQVTAATLLGGGYSNRNTRLDTRAGRSYVLRQYRPAPDDGPGARTCAIEEALARRLRGVVPVPEVVAADAAGAEAGEPVLLSRHVVGVPLRAALAAAGEQDQAGLGQAAGRVLAAIGAIGFERAGLFTDGTLTPTADGMPASLPEFVEQCLAAGRAGAVLDPAELAGLRSLAAAYGPLADRAGDASQLVHSDFNPKNLLVAREPDGWSVTAVLDWEFAFSGSPLHDIGNMLRFTDEIPPAFAAAFTGGFGDAGGSLPPDWREVSRALDLYALADLLTRPVGHRYFGKAVAAIRASLTGR
jgi:aminoglycoside phosphotransferase (APT) family kinase protein